MKHHQDDDEDGDERRHWHGSVNKQEHADHVTCWELM